MNYIARKKIRRKGIKYNVSYQWIDNKSQGFGRFELTVRNKSILPNYDFCVKYVEDKHGIKNVVILAISKIK